MQSAGESTGLEGELLPALVWPMLALTMPVGFLVAFVLQGVVLLLGNIGVGNGEIGAGLLIVFWIAATVLGYLQWFVFLPALWRRWKSERKN